MKVTFPHMGNTHIAIKTLIKGLRLDVIPPPPISKKTIELGIKYSPEFACLPLKINMGNFIEALENGADTILMAGGWGPCRFGYYAQVERDILTDLGYDFNIVILEAPDSRLSELFKQLKTMGENVSLWEFFKAVKFAWNKLNAVEQMERKLEYILPRVVNKQAAEKIYDDTLINIDKADKREDVRAVTASGLDNMEKLIRHDKNILKIGLVGEIYTILEPACNYDIVRYLGRLNVEVTRSIYTTDWVNDHLLGGIIKESKHQHIINCAKPYLNYWVGGHGQESVGSTVDFARRNYDGIIQIGPMTCMPEIVAQSVLGKVSDEQGIPCMTMYFDEHAGTAGTYTRLEAFADMLQRKTVSRYQENNFLDTPLSKAAARR